jgi:hypothetical protein|nr:FlgD immunoglobulin-like domain containing protein [Candidatus Krumholzibacteria bacterium]
MKRRISRLVEQVALLLVLATTVLATTALATPTLVIEPTTFAPGDLVLVTYDGFEPGGYEGTINVDGAPVLDIDILPGGNLTFFWPTPSDLSFGGHDVDICAACDQGDLEERTNTVRITVDSGELTGSEFNLQPWAVEITQGVRGDIPTRTPPAEDLVLPSEEIMHVANRRTVVRVYPWAQGGPDFTTAFGVKAYLWLSVNGTSYGPYEAETPRLPIIRSDATMDDLRSDLRRTWNFVLPQEATRLAVGETEGSFNLVVTINPDEPGRAPECPSCFDDNTIYLNDNRFRHVGRQDAFGLKFRPHLMECEVEKDDGSTDLVPRPTLVHLANTVRSLHDLLPVADGSRGVRLMPWRYVDWSGHQDDWNDGQDAFMIENYLPGGELRAAPPNDFYAFLFWGGGPNCSGHAHLNSPFLRSAACGAPPYTAAHELNHAIGAAHAGNGHGEAGGGGYDTEYPGWHGQVEDDSWGLDVYTLRLYPPEVPTIGDNRRHDFMSYGGNQWVSRYSWNLTAENLGSPEVTVRKQGLPEILSPPATLADLDYVAFRGRIDQNGQLDLAPFFASYVPDQGQDQGDGQYEIAFYDANNGLLSTSSPQRIGMQDVQDYGGLFAEAITLPVGWAEMRLRENGVVTQTWQRSANPPVVEVTSPMPGFQLPNQGTLTLTWGSVDPDGDSLTYRIFGLHGADNELFTLAMGLTTTFHHLDLGSLPGGGDWTFIVEASDGFDRVYSEFVSGSVDPTAPQAMILEPADGSVHVAGAKVPAVGTFADIQGEIDEGNTAWYLDDVYQGFGSTIDLENLSVGQHTLRFVVYNVFQVEGSTETTFEVIDDLAVPAPQAPANGATNVTSPVRLDWAAAPGAISYRVQLSRDASFAEIAAEGGNIGEAFIEFEPNEPGLTIYWRVMAEHGTLPTEYSPIQSFTMAHSASSVDDVPAADLLALSVLPNPFNPATTVSFDLPRSGQVQLAVYNLAGRRVRLLADGSYPSGRHEVRWDGRDGRGLSVGSGVYLFRLETPSGITSRRATLLK